VSGEAALFWELLFCGWLGLVANSHKLN